MKMKKILAMLLVGAMALTALAGCGGGAASAPAASAPAASADEGGYKGALIQQHQTNAFQIAVTEGAEAKAAELGVELNILSADQDAAKQISQIERMETLISSLLRLEKLCADGYEFVFIDELIYKDNFEIKNDGTQCKKDG